MVNTLLYHYRPTALDFSGVPQESVLGPLHFLYIHDLPRHLHPRSNYNADDTLLYRVINALNDIAIFQQDLNCLS